MNLSSRLIEFSCLSLLAAFTIPVSVLPVDADVIGKADGEGSAQLQVKDLLWWLPADTETVEVTDLPQTIPDDNPNTGPEEQPELQKSLSEGFLHLPVAGLATVVHGSLYHLLRGQQVRITMVGSRNFRAPSGLGGMLYEGCEITVFSSDLGAAGRSLDEALKKAALQTEQIEGQTVFEFHEELEQDMWTIFIARPQPNVILDATDKNFLRQVLQRMAVRPPTRALPESFPEWKELDSHALIWAIRHYNPGGEKTDPSSPLGNGWGAKKPDKQAIGLVYFFDIPNKVAHVKYLSDNKDALEIAKGYWSIPQEGLAPQFTQSRTGVVDISVELNSKRTIFIFFFALMGALGHAIYL
jgi:hypothetical protein